MTDEESPKSVAVRFGARAARLEHHPGGIDLTLPHPLLFGPDVEDLACLPAAARFEETSPFQTLRHKSQLIGAAVCPVDDDLESVSRSAYESLFDLLGPDFHAYRIWHYVPDINGSTAGLENYRIFNVGRRKAFDAHFGPEAETQMPAASAVGNSSQALIIAFVAGTDCPQFFENPKQTPAYHYPNTYGPKAPSFARATIAPPMVYLSGTASIRGSETMHVGDLEGQFQVTADNLLELTKRLGFETWQEVTKQPKFSLKVYLRDAGRLDSLKRSLREVLGGTASNMIVVEADICRRDLDIEIEAAFHRA